MAVNKAFNPGQAVNPAQIKTAGELARRKIYTGIPEDDVALALAICQKYGFDPLLKHLVLISSNIKDEASGQWQKRYTAYVTRDGLLHVAHISGQLDGLEVAMGKDELGEWAEAAVYRKDMSRPFRYRVYLSEYAREPRGAWKTHPRAMLTKTAEVFALRRAFDVALTPVEEIGFEDATVGIPVAEVDRKDGLQERNPGPAREQEAKQFAGVESASASAEESGATNVPAGQAKEQKKIPSDWPADWPPEPSWGTEPAGPGQPAPGNNNGDGKNNGSGSNNSAGGSKGNGRRRLF